MKKVLIVVLIFLNLLLMVRKNVISAEEIGDATTELVTDVVVNFLSIETGSIHIDFEFYDKQYSMKLEYDYYSCYNGVYKYYLADVECGLDNNNEIEIVCVKIMQDELIIDENNYELKIYFYTNSINDMFVIEHIISNSSLKNLSIYDQCSEDTRNRIISTNEKVDIFFKNNQKNLSTENMNNSFNENINVDNGFANRAFIGFQPIHIDLNNGSLKNYSELLAKTDDVLDSYSPKGKTSISQNNLRKDDDIVKMIPKEYFYTVGNHNYFGKEFGYFIDTYSIGDGKFSSNVFLFDIIVKMPGMISPTFIASYTIKPVFQFCYSYLPSSAYTDYEWDSFVEPNYSSIVIPSYETINYCVKNVDIKFMVENKNSLNVEDSGYVAEEDYGDYIQQSRYYFCGDGAIADRENFFYDTVLFAAGFIDYVGTAISIMDYAVTVYDNLENNKYSITREGVTNNYYTPIAEFHHYRQDQIDDYSGLIKAINLSPNCNLKNENDDSISEKPFLIGTNSDDNYVTGMVSLTSAGDRETGEESIIYMGASMDYVYDDLDNDTISYIYSGKGSYCYGNYKIGQEPLSLNEECLVSTDVGGEYEYTKFTPAEKGKYTIETTGVYDTYMYLYDDSGALLAEADSSGDGFNAKISFDLDSNVTYHIITKFVQSNMIGEYGIKVSYAQTDDLNLNTTEQIFLENNYKVYQFIPTLNSDYLIESYGEIDIDIIVLTENGEEVALFNNITNNDSNSGFIYRVEVGLLAGEKYLIKISPYNYQDNLGVGNTTLKISASE